MSSDVSSLKVAAVVAFYMSCALVMVMVNKTVLISSPGLPLVFITIQTMLAIVLLHVTSALSSRIELPKFEANQLDVARKLAPVLAVCVVGLVFNTLCLRDVEASFFQIARGLQLPLTILLSSIQMGVTPSRNVIVSAVVVAVGFFMGVARSADVPLSATPSLVSLLYGFLSSFFIAYHAVLIKASLVHCNNSTIQLAWWSNVSVTVFLIPCIFFTGEYHVLIDLVNEGGATARTFYIGSFITGVVGFLLSIAGLLSIKVTSAVTHMFSSAARSVLQTLLGVWIFNDYLTVNRASSILVILAGTMFYTYIKSNEQKPAQGQNDMASEMKAPRHSTDVEAPARDNATWTTAEEADKGNGLNEKV
ncbi:hypothetical protein C8J56DRAFT_920154 [Mycena floridula]|nr:hypothetical protein C8J56DRAFT_920154 [Mycena floridula]